MWQPGDRVAVQLRDGTVVVEEAKSIRPGRSGNEPVFPRPDFARTHAAIARFHALLDGSDVRGPSE